MLSQRDLELKFPSLQLALAGSFHILTGGDR